MLVVINDVVGVYLRIWGFNVLCISMLYN